jgi:hypothetical protein
LGVMILILLHLSSPLRRYEHNFTDAASSSSQRLYSA